MKEEIGNPSVESLKDHIDELETKHEREIEKLKNDLAWNEPRNDLIAWLESYIEGLRAIDSRQSDAIIMADTLCVVKECIEHDFYKDFSARNRKDKKGFEFIAEIKHQNYVRHKGAKK